MTGDRVGAATPAGDADARYEISLETYNKSINIEAQLMVLMANRYIAPAAFEYQRRLGESVEPLARKAATSCAVKVTPTLNDDPCVFDKQVVDTIENAARDLGLASMRQPSGASHDAMYMARVCPTGMIFVPCEKGVSYNEAENAKPEDLAAGARVLTAALLDLANR